MTTQKVKPAAIKTSWQTTVAQLIGLILAFTVVKSAIAEPYYVPSGSMEPTLLIGDELLATKFSYGYGLSSFSIPLGVTLPRTERIFGKLPERGDVIVFRWPGDRSQIWVKRVIGLPGDRIQMRQGRLWINGGPVDLRRDGMGQMQTDDGVLIATARYIETLPGGLEHPIFKLEERGPLDQTAEITVPNGSLFVMGDNRDNSADSRLSVADGGIGLLPVDDVVGRVAGLVGSWDLATKQQPIWTWPRGLRFSRFFTPVH